MGRPTGVRSNGVEIFDLETNGEPLVVISLPMTRSSDLLRALNPAEREVARDVVAGLSNIAIARRRGRSPRTIANQLASTYRKLGVSSRAELTARLLGEE